MDNIVGVRHYKRKSAETFLCYIRRLTQELFEEGFISENDVPLVQVLFESSMRPRIGTASCCLDGHRFLNISYSKIDDRFYVTVLERREEGAHVPYGTDCTCA